MIADRFEDLVLSRRILSRHLADLGDIIDRSRSSLETMETEHHALQVAVDQVELELVGLGWWAP